jgi:hypothetical protein
VFTTAESAAIVFNGISASGHTKHARTQLCLLTSLASIVLTGDCLQLMIRLQACGVQDAGEMQITAHSPTS